MPYFVNEAIPYNQILEKACWLAKKLGGARSAKFIFEETGMNSVFIKDFEANGLIAEGCIIPEQSPDQNKGIRLQIVTSKMSREEIVFPETGAEPLIQKITGLTNDRMVSAFTTMVLSIAEEYLRGDAVILIGRDPDDD